MADRTDKLTEDAATKWTTPSRQRRNRSKVTTEEMEEGAVLGQNPEGPPLRRTNYTSTTPAGRVQGVAETKFLSALQRVSEVRRAQLPDTYDNDGQVRQQNITKHFKKWTEAEGEEMVEWAVEKFFREVYLWQKDDTSYNFSPHSNLSNWMKGAGRRAIRMEWRNRALQNMLREQAIERMEEMEREAMYPDDVAEEYRKQWEREEMEDRARMDLEQ